MKKAFSLIELSIVILIVGIIIAGVTQSSSLVSKMKINSARTQTNSSPVSSIKDLAIWLETTSERSLVNQNNSFNVQDGDTIRTWQNISSTSIVTTAVEQTNSANRPDYVSSAINGLPAIRFGGTKFLAMNNNFCTRNFTIFALIDIGVTTTNGPFDGWQVLFADATGGANDSVPIVVAGSTVLMSSYTGSVDSVLYAGNSKVVTNDSPHIVTVSRNMQTGRRDIWVDGANNANDLNGGIGRVLNANMNMWIGRAANNSNYPGLIGEIIIFDRVLTTEERQSVEQYLQKKWGVLI